MNIRDLPSLERPREKLARYGCSRLSTAELLTIMIRTGHSKASSVILAKRLAAFLRGRDLTTLTPDLLGEVQGIGKIKAIELIACLELGRRLAESAKPIVIGKPSSVLALLQEIRLAKREHFVALYLDSRQQLIAKEIISIGTVSASIVHPREVYEPALRHLASYVIVAHNHPSGSIEPSVEDLAVTERLEESGDLLGIPLLAHLIVSRENYTVISTGEDVVL